MKMYLFTEKKWILKLPLIAMFGITALALVLTFSRGCYLGILLSMMMLLLFIDKRFVILGIVGLILLPFVVPTTILDRFLSIGNVADSSTSYRVYIWLGTAAMLKDYFFTGIGLGVTSFNILFLFQGINNLIC